jgi:predicted HTH domain antitoxin
MKLLTMERAAKLADLTIDAFMDLLAQTGANAVDYPPEELDQELRVKI